MNGMRAIHSGEILRDELDELKLSANAYAKALDVPANRITAILNEQRGITEDTALRFARFFVTWISFAVFGIAKKWSVIMFMGGGFFIACVVLVLAGMLFPAITSPLAKEASGQGTMAFIQCKNYVRDHLKAPSTADFPFFDNMTNDIGNGVYVVNSYVDAQNGFGAMIRSTYQCKVQYIGGDNADQRNWRLILLCQISFQPSPIVM